MKKIILTLTLLFALIVLNGCTLFVTAEDLQAKLRIASKYIVEQNYEDAMLVYENVIEIDEKRGEAYEGLADIYMLQNMADKAEKILLDALKVTDDKNQIKVKLAEIYSKQEKFAEAETTLQEVLTDDNQNVRAYKTLVQLYIEEGENEKAISLLKSAIDDNKENKDETYFYQALSDLHISNELYDDALQWLIAGFNVNPSDPQLYLSLESIKDTDLLLKQGVSLIEEDPKNPAGKILNLYGHLVDLEFQKVIDMYNDSPTAIQNSYASIWAALSYSNMGDSKNALKLAKQINPDKITDEKILKNIIYFYEAIGHSEKAIEIGEKAIERNPLALEFYTILYALTNNEKYLSMLGLLKWSYTLENNPHNIGISTIEEGDAVAVGASTSSGDYYSEDYKNQTQFIKLNHKGKEVWKHSSIESGPFSTTPMVDHLQEKNGFTYFQKNEYESVYVPLVAIKEDQQLWEKDDVTTTPVFSGNADTMFVGTANEVSGSLQALSLSGDVKWTFPKEHAIDIINEPTVAQDGTIYITTLASDYGGYTPIYDFTTIEKTRGVYAINPDGSLKWAHTGAATIEYSEPFIAPNGTIFVASSDVNEYDTAFLQGFNANGERIISTELKGASYEAPISMKDFMLYKTDEYLYSIRYDGTINWSYPISPMATIVETTDENIYIADNNLSNLETTLLTLNYNGDAIWEYTFDDFVDDPTRQYWEKGMTIQSVFSIDHSVLVFVQDIATKQYKMYSFWNDGTLKAVHDMWWQKGTPETLNHINITANKAKDTIYFPFGHTLYAYSAKSLAFFPELNSDQTNPYYYLNQAKIIPKTIDEELDHITISIAYPTIKINSNKNVQDKINQVLIKVALDYRKEADEMNSYDIIMGEKYYYGLSYEVKYNQDGILSILFLYDTYTGGAHSQLAQVSYNFNLNTGEEYELQAFFNDDSNFMETINQSLLRQIPRSSYSFFEPFSGLEEHPQFYVTNKGIGVYFQPYEYTPFVDGFPEFLIMESTLPRVGSN